MNRSEQSREYLAGWILLLLVLWAASGRATAGAPDAGRFPTIDQVLTVPEQLDSTKLTEARNVADHVRRQVEQLPASLNVGVDVPEEYAARVRADIAKFVLGDASRQAMKEGLEAVSRALRQKDLPAARLALVSVRPLIYNGLVGAYATVSFWRARVQVERERERRIRMLEANQLPAREFAEEAQTLREIDELGNAGEFLQALARLASLMTRQEEFSAGLSLSAADGKERGVDMQPRQSRCPKESVEPTGYPVPQLLRGPPTESYYPPAEKNSWRAGDVLIRARIAPSGCATHFGIARHSGYDALDQAAIRWAEVASFRPAGPKEQGVESEMTFKLRFVIKR